MKKFFSFSFSFVLLLSMLFISLDSYAEATQLLTVGQVTVISLIIHLKK